MYIGIDFDNTIICYDQVFHDVAVERTCIPKDFPADKTLIRDYLRRENREEQWTEIQGYVYGDRMSQAEPFPGVLDFFAEMNRRNITTAIISHKTRHPYKGPKYDLHKSARSWLENKGLVELTRDNIFFCLTKEQKLSCIAEQQCSHFIDDLPELLLSPYFPKSTISILFDPNDNHRQTQCSFRLTDWNNGISLILPTN